MVKATTLAAGLLWDRTGAAARSLIAPSQDDARLQAAKARIEQHRKSDGVVQVRDASGRAVPGAAVRVEQTRHAFRFGANLFRFGRNRDNRAEAEYRARFAALLNYATLGFYWRDYEAKRGRPQYAYTDGAVEWCAQNGITCKGHPLAWPEESSVPAWLPSDTSEVAQLSTARVHDCVERFRGRINMWDVVNEPTSFARHKNPMGAWATALGAAEFTRRHLETARAANSGATLLVNDYETGPAYLALLRDLGAMGRNPFDAIGIQSHMHGGAWALGRIQDVCDSLAVVGAPIHFTETTVVSGPRRGPGYNWGPSTPEGESRQASYVADLYTMLFAHPAVGAITWWDFTDDGAWQGAPAGLLRNDMTPKPAFDRLYQLIRNQWWTNAGGRTDSSGEFTVRAFHGTQWITVTPALGPATSIERVWQANSSNRFDVVLGK